MMIRRFALLGFVAALAVTMAVPAVAQDVSAEAEDDFNPVVVKLTGPANLRDLADKAGYDGGAAAEYLFEVPEGVNILGAPGGRSGNVNGGAAIVSGKWPDDAEVWLVVSGHVYGGGGRGGNGGDLPGSTDGGRGGDAVVAQAPITVVVMEGGSIKAGGGGGAGAEGAPSAGGSGGGGGFPNGDPGQAGSPQVSGDGEFTGGDWGRAGTPGGGGSGGRRGNPGGNGGNAAMPGDSLSRAGGAPGNAVRLNDFDVTVVNNGQIYGETF